MTGRPGSACAALLLALGPLCAQEAAPAGQAPAVKAAPLLPAQDMTPLGMFMNADVIVKTVMVGLALASVLTWTIWLAKGVELLVAKRRLRRALMALDAAPSLQEASRGLGTDAGEAARLVEAAKAELALSEGLSREGIKERVASRFERIEAAANRHMTRGTGTLATIGSTAPFIGLFGTVWGIMNAFVGIARVQTSNLAVVAPGIAEALLATATGLVAAIPAVVIYNVFARGILGHRALVTDAAAAVLRLVGRDLDGAPRRMAAAAE